MLAAALVVTGACTGEGVVTGAGLDELPTAGTPTYAQDPEPSTTRASRRPRAPAAATTGLLRVVVQDEDDLEPRSQVPLRYSGPRSGRIVSGRDGIAAVRLPAGEYRIEAVAGCHARLEVFRGSGGTAGVVAGDDPTAARITVQARRRYWAGTPLQPDISPPWPAGTTITFRFRVYDRCKDLEAPGVAMRDVRYRTSSNLEVVGAPARAADGASDLTLRLRCTGAGDASLIVYDPENPDDLLDLLKLRPATADPAETWCGPAA